MRRFYTNDAEKDTIINDDEKFHPMNRERATVVLMDFANSVFTGA